MTIVHQGTGPGPAIVAPAQHRSCANADHPSAVDIERMLRADRIRGAYFGLVAAGLAASWRGVAP